MRNWRCPLADQNVFDLSDLNSSCQLNTQRLQKILEEDVNKDIACLESNLDQFVKFVRRENPKYISRIELERFVTKFFPKMPKSPAIFSSWSMT